MAELELGFGFTIAPIRGAPKRHFAPALRLPDGGLPCPAGAGWTKLEGYGYR